MNVIWYTLDSYVTYGNIYHVDFMSNEWSELGGYENAIKKKILTNLTIYLLYSKWIVYNVIPLVQNEISDICES